MAGNGTSGKGRTMSPWPPRTIPLRTIPPRRVNRRRRAIVVAIGVTVIILLCGLLGVYGHYETTHDIPNPFWSVFNRTFTYTPEQGPPAGLFRSRPDEITRQYLTDYIRVAGTYPCVHDLDRYDLDYYNEPDLFLQGKPCTVTRPVASFAVISVTIARSHCDCIPVFAAVHLRVGYADGQSHDFSRDMVPWHYERDWLTLGNMDCWVGDTSDLYPDIVSQVPPGVQYHKPTDGVGVETCQSAQTAPPPPTPPTTPPTTPPLLDFSTGTVPFQSDPFSI
jgi:hypothetical protein